MRLHCPCGRVCVALSQGIKGHAPIVDAVQSVLLLFGIGDSADFDPVRVSIDELSDGYKGPLIHDEGLFIGLEGV